MYDSFLGPLNHIGIAVPDIEAAIKMYRDVFGVTDITEPTDLPPQGVTYAFVNLPSGQVELIQPYGDKSPITNSVFSLCCLSAYMVDHLIRGFTARR